MSEKTEIFGKIISARLSAACETGSDSHVFSGWWQAGPTETDRRTDSPLSPSVCRGLAITRRIHWSHNAHVPKKELPEVDCVVKICKENVRFFMVSIFNFNFNAFVFKTWILSLKEQVCSSRNRWGLQGIARRTAVVSKAAKLIAEQNYEEEELPGPDTSKYRSEKLKPRVPGRCQRWISGDIDIYLIPYLYPIPYITLFIYIKRHRKKVYIYIHISYIHHWISGCQRDVTRSGVGLFFGGLLSSKHLIAERFFHEW